MKPSPLIHYRTRKLYLGKEEEKHPPKLGFSLHTPYQLLYLSSFCSPPPLLHTCLQPLLNVDIELRYHVLAPISTLNLRPSLLLEYYGHIFLYYHQMFVKAPWFAFKFFFNLLFIIKSKQDNMISSIAYLETIYRSPYSIGSSDNQFSIQHPSREELRCNGKFWSTSFFVQSKVPSFPIIQWHIYPILHILKLT